MGAIGKALQSLSESFSLSKVSEKDLSDERKKFSILSLLVTLIATINYGHPSLNGSVNPQRLIRPEMEDRRPHIMEALLSLLVRKTEIMACMTYGPTSAIVALEQGGQAQGEQIAQAKEAPSDDLDEPTHRPGKSQNGFRIAAFENGDARVPGGGHYMLEQRGESLWGLPPREIRAKLVNYHHIATVADYLNRFRTATLPAERNALSDKFVQYIIQACWEKMRSRAGHWAMVGLLYQLSLIPKGKLNIDVQPSTRPDGRLANYLISTSTAPDLSTSEKGPRDFLRTEVLPYYKPEYSNGEDIPYLLSLCQERAPLYTEDTVLEFHRLLVATLLAQAALLQRYKKVHEVRNDEEMEKIGIRLGLVERLLQAIVYSSAFSSHMDSLGGIHPPVLSWPMTSQIPEYLAFAQANDIYCRSGRSPPSGNRNRRSASSKEGGGASGLEEIGSSKGGRGIFASFLKAGKGKSRSSGAGKGGSVSSKREKSLEEELLSESANMLFEEEESLPVDSNNAPANDEHAKQVDDEDGDVESIEFDGLPTPRVMLESEDLIDAVQSWLKLLVKYTTARRALEDYCETLGRGEDRKIEISLLSVTPTETTMPLWQDVSEVLESALKKQYLFRSSSMHQEIISYIKTRVGDGNTRHNIIDVFTDIIRGVERPISYTVHCEAALVAFASLDISSEGDDQGLAEIQRRLERQEIAITKLCCPACWHLITFLQEGNERYNVDGRHSTFFPVQLPPLLPYQAVKHMVKQFGRYLRDELVVMDELRKSKKIRGLGARRPSRQSIGSNVSHKSGESDLAGALSWFYQH